MALDKAEIKVVGGEYRGKPFFAAIGTVKGRARKIEGAASAKEISGKGAYESGAVIDWRIYLHRKSKPDWFPQEQYTLLATNATTAVSGSIDAQNAKIIPISEEKKFTIKSADMRISISDKGIKVKKGPRDRYRYR